MRQKNRLGGVYSDSTAGPELVRRIVARIATVMNGGPLPPGVTSAPPGYLALGPLDAIPADATVTNWHWGGQPADAALTDLLARIECTWFEEDGLIRINRAGMIQSDAPRISVSPQTGLTGRPSETDEGFEVRMFLNPLVRLGSVLTVDSEVIGKSFTAKMVGLRHSADNWKGKFQTLCDLRELSGADFAAASAPLIGT